MSRQPGTLAEWARDARRQADIESADEAARRAGVPASWLRSVEAGQIRRPNAERVSALEALYGSRAPAVPPDDPEEERLARQILEAYERGFDKGLRIGRGEG